MMLKISSSTIYRVYTSVNYHSLHSCKLNTLALCQRTDHETTKCINIRSMLIYPVVTTANACGENAGPGCECVVNMMCSTSCLLSAKVVGVIGSYCYNSAHCTKGYLKTSKNLVLECIYLFHRKTGRTMGSPWCGNGHMHWMTLYKNSYANVNPFASFCIYSQKEGRYIWVGGGGGGGGGGARKDKGNKDTHLLWTTPISKFTLCMHGFRNGTSRNTRCSHDQSSP